MRKENVIIFHGIAKSSKHMEKLAKFLTSKNYEVINYNYPSTKYNIADLTNIIIKDLGEDIYKMQKVHFIGYSMGGLLVRALINKLKLNNLGNVVQLAPPNNGSEVADFLKNNILFKVFYGPAGQDLTTNNINTLSLLGKVNYNLGIIAGDLSLDPICSYIIKLKNDGKVSVNSTKVTGMKEHIIIKASHLYFPKNKQVLEQTYNFLKFGKFKT